MNNELTDKILDELDQAGQFILKFRDTGNIPKIERDIVLGKLQHVYEFTQQIQVEKNEASEDEKKTIVFDTDHKTQKVVKESFPTDQEFEDEVLQVEIEPVKELPLDEGKREPQGYALQSQSVTNQLHVTKTEILAEKFQSQSFLNDALAQFQSGTDLSKKMQNQPLKDIFSAINLNDKFLFIKELFTNDAALYQSTVEKLNSAGNFNDAIRYLDGNFDWDFSDPMVQNFLELVRRRFL